jgi:hypothetical protein
MNAVIVAGCGYLAVAGVVLAGLLRYDHQGTDARAAVRRNAKHIGSLAKVSILWLPILAWMLRPRGTR